MDLKEFQQGGYLQEVNRQFFHPLGLALAIQHDDETGETSLYGIFDSREDPEGFVFTEITQADIDRALAIKAKAAEKIAARVALSAHIHPASGVQTLHPHRIDA